MKGAHHCIGFQETPYAVAIEWLGHLGDAAITRHGKSLLDYNHFAYSDEGGAVVIVGWEPGVIIKIPPMWMEKRDEREAYKPVFPKDNK